MKSRLLFTTFLLALSLSGYTQTKKVLLEWYASAANALSPDAAMIVDTLKADYTHVIGVGVHAGGYVDDLQNSDTKAMHDKFFINFYPSGMVNRKAGSQGLIVQRSYWEDYVKAELGKSPEVVLDITNKYDAFKRALDISIDVEYLQSVSAGTYLTVYLVEDKVSGTGTGYDQKNATNTTTGHAYFGKGDPIKNYEHRHVLREYVTSLSGNGLGSGLSKGTKKKYSESITLSKDYDQEKVSVVAFVSYSSSSAAGNEILNAEIAPIISSCQSDFRAAISGQAATFTSYSVGYDSLLWSFGDGNTSTQTNPKHTYSKGGEFKVTLTVYSEGKVCATSDATVDIPYQCTADFDAVIDNFKVAFENKSTGDATTYIWEFGDGNYSTSKNPGYTYSTAGTYTVRLSVEDPFKWVCSSIEKVITLTDYSCTTKFSHSVQDLKVSFTNASTGDVDTRLWDFGDGTITTVENPAHTYATTGEFTVCLKNFDLNGDSCGTSFCEEIAVDVASNLSTLHPMAIDIYPNPSSGVFQIIMPEGMDAYALMVYNTVGAEVVSERVMDNRFALDLAAFPKGVYQVILRGGSRSFSSLIIKE